VKNSRELSTGLSREFSTRCEEVENEALLPIL